MASRSLARPTAEFFAWIVAAATIGVLAVRSPVLTTGVLAVGLLLVLPLHWLFAVLVGTATAQTLALPIGGVTVRADEVVVLIFAVRALWTRDRMPLGWPAFAAIGFVGFVLATSVLHALDVRASVMSAGLLGFGVLAFIGASTRGATRDERVALLRTWLIVSVGGAAIGIAAVAASLATGSTFGITRLPELGGVPAATGLAFEHNLFGSTCAIAAIVLLGIWRAGADAVVPARLALVGFWICVIATALSLTRGAWIAALVGFVAVFLVLPRGVAGRTFASLAVQGVVVAALGLGMGVVIGSAQEASEQAIVTLQAQGERALELRSGTGGQRTREWTTALEEVRQAPLFGYGANGYGQRHVERTLRGNDPSYLGNWVIRTLYDAGVIGLVLLGAFVAGVVWPRHRLRHATGEDAGVAGALVAGGLVMVVAYLAADGFLLVWPWLFLGLVWQWRMAAESEFESESGRRAIPSATEAT